MNGFILFLLGLGAGIILAWGINYIKNYWPMIRLMIKGPTQSTAAQSSVDTLSGASQRPSDEEMYGDFGEITPAQAAKIEDLSAGGKIDTTIEIADKRDPKWLEQAIELTQPASGEDFVQLDSGLLTVNQLNAMLQSIPLELTFVDANNQFLYYNRHKVKEEMFVGREPSEVGDPLGGSHPDFVHNYVAWVVQQLRTKKQEIVPLVIPSANKKKMIVHFYKGMYDKKGDYVGINQFVVDFIPIIKFYLEETKQTLIPK